MTFSHVEKHHILSGILGLSHAELAESVGNQQQDLDMVQILAPQGEIAASVDVNNF